MWDCLEDLILSEVVEYLLWEFCAMEHSRALETEQLSAGFMTCLLLNLPKPWFPHMLKSEKSYLLGVEG